jgi:hypothetical protein
VHVVPLSFHDWGCVFHAGSLTPPFFILYENVGLWPGFPLLAGGSHECRRLPDVLFSFTPEHGISNVPMLTQPVTGLYVIM